MADMFQFAAHRLFLDVARALGTITRATATALLQARRIEASTDDFVAGRKVFGASALNHDDRVLLQVVPFAGDIGRDLHSISKADAGDLADCRVWFSWSLGGYLGADAPLKGRRIEGRAVLKYVKTPRECDGFRFPRRGAPRPLSELIYGCHVLEILMSQSELEYVHPEPFLAKDTKNLHKGSTNTIQGERAERNSALYDARNEAEEPLDDHGKNGPQKVDSKDTDHDESQWPERVGCCFKVTERHAARGGQQ